MSVRGREPYRAAAETLLRESGCTVRRWLTTRRGRAYTSADDWGIEAPPPKGPVAYAIYAHEIAHQLLHRTRNRPRWREEFEAWDWSLATFDRFGLPGRELALARARRSCEWAIVKAIRRSRTGDRLAEEITAAAPLWLGIDARTLR